MRETLMTLGIGRASIELDPYPRRIHTLWSLFEGNRPRDGRLDCPSLPGSPPVPPTFRNTLQGGLLL